MSQRPARHRATRARARLRYFGADGNEVNGGQLVPTPPARSASGCTSSPFLALNQWPHSPTDGPVAASWTGLA